MREVPQMSGDSIFARWRGRGYESSDCARACLIGLLLDKVNLSSHVIEQ